MQGRADDASHPSARLAAEPSAAESSAAETFARFYRQHHDRLRYRLRVLVRDDDTAEDLVADTMVLIWSRWSELDGPGDAAAGFPRLRAYAYTTAHFKARNHQRSTTHHEPLSGADLENALASRHDASSGVEYAETMEQIGRLPEQQRRTLQLKLDGYDDREIAARLGVERTTVRSNLVHARRKITDYLHRKDPARKS